MTARSLLLPLWLFVEGCAASWTTLRRELPPPTPATPLGTALLFKTTLDSAAFLDALTLFRSSAGTPLVAAQRYELLPDIERLARLLSGLPITLVRTDSLAPTQVGVWLELDYLHTLHFTLQQRDTTWGIIALEYIPWRRSPVPIFPPPEE